MLNQSAFDVFEFPDEEEKYFVPDVLLREPQLLVPNKKPIGRMAIDWSHPLAKGLTHFVLFTQANYNQPYDLVTGAYLPKTGPASDSSSPLYNAVRDGAYFTETDNISYTIPDVYLGTKCTVTTHVDFDDNVGTLFQYFLSHGTVSAQPNFNWYLAESLVTNGNSSDLICNIQVGTQPQWDEFYTTIYNKTAPLTAVLDGTRTVQYHNNQSNVSNTTTGRQSATTEDMRVGQRNDANADRRTGGVMKYVIIHGDRALSEDEVLSLHADPYQFLIPA